MQHFDLRILISENSPSKKEEWNKLAEQCSNIWQSTFYDEVQLYFNNHSRYFECYSGDELIGGLKLYYYESKKLPSIIRSISTRATQGSEFIFNKKKIELLEKFSFLLNEKIISWLIKEKLTSFYEYSFYGEAENLIQITDYKKIWESRIGIATIDLRKSVDELWKKINPKHRSEVIKAEKNSVTVEFTDDIESFFLLLDETYKTQWEHKPNKNFIRKEYEILKENNAAQLAFAKHEGNYLCGALLYNYGLKSLYNFGGTIKNSIGAGQFLHWEIMKYLKANNFHHYLLGETSLEVNESNRKFSEGITKFKLRFGAEQLPTYHRGFVLKPMQLKIWNRLQKIFIRT